MDLSPSEVVEVPGISLNEDTTRGLVPAQVEYVKESVFAINEELSCVGQSLKAVAANLADVKDNIKPGNWRAFLKSGAINCSERFAIDLVSAYKNWLGGTDVEDNLLASLTPRSLALMGSKGVTDKERQRVFEAVGNGERVTESVVRVLVKGAKKKKISSPKKAESEKIRLLQNKLESYKEVIRNLEDENKKLSKMLASRAKLDSIL